MVETDTLLEPHLQAAIATLDGRAPLLGTMARYHLGWIDATGRPMSSRERAASQGKRIRPTLALLCCAATGGDPATAAPVATAIELLHNFTLIHDDIQDRSPDRRHRPTVWSLWGEGQAINAGDALFAAAHLTLYRLRDGGVPAEVVLTLSDAFDRVTIAIVEGQVQDLGFEGRADVTPAAYLAMIAGKSAAIVRYAAWAGALLGEADAVATSRFGDFGEALGLAFQVRDDALGIWGNATQTGKAEADDIRRRKQSLPILLLRQQVPPTTRDKLNTLYKQPEIDEAGVARVLALLTEHRIQEQVAARVASLHDEARAALLTAQPDPNPARDRLLGLVDSLAVRQG